MEAFLQRTDLGWSFPAFSYIQAPSGDELDEYPRLASDNNLTLNNPLFIINSPSTPGWMAALRAYFLDGISDATIRLHG
jgi:hypothetical protein